MAKAAAKAQKQQQKNHSKEILGIVFFALGLFLIFCVYTTSAGFLGSSIQPFLFGLLGLWTYILPLVMIALGIMNFATRLQNYKRSKFILVILLIVSLISFLHMFWSNAMNDSNYFLFLEDSYNLGNASHLGSGIIGGLLPFPFIKLLGNAGSYILFVTAILICAIVLLNISVREMGAKVGGRIKEGHQKRVAEKEYKRKTLEMYKEEKQFANVNRQKLFIEDMKVPGSDFSNPNNPFPTIDYESEEEIVEQVLHEERPAVFAERLKKAKTGDIPETIQISIDGVPKKYYRPVFSLLNKTSESKKKPTEDTAVNARLLEETLASFNVSAHVINTIVGPAITRYELQLAQGVMVKKIVNLQDNLAMNLAATSLRIEAPIPGKAAVGIEIPNKNVSMVGLREIVEDDSFVCNPSPLTAALGKDLSGKRITIDLARMPHLMIAGTTGSGKSVCINNIILSLLYKSSPEDVRLILIDPKQVELNMYNGVPHLLVPVVVDPHKAAGALNWAVNEMEQRYNKFKDTLCRDLAGYNKSAEEKLPLVVVVVDELADLMMVAGNEVETSICRLAQKGRAAGIHLIVATQRPSVDVITGLIKANIPSRIAFAVSSTIDSRTILNMGGAEKLLGKGDMLYFPSTSNKPMRIQGAFVTDEEVQAITDYVRTKNSSEYSDDVIEEIEANAASSMKGGTKHIDKDDGDQDGMLRKAMEYIVERGEASVSMLQRGLRIGHPRAGRLVDDLENLGLISKGEGSKPRKVLFTHADILKMFEQNEEGDL